MTLPIPDQRPPSHREPILTEETQQTLAHVNEDHVSELLLTVRAMTDLSAPQDARLLALYTDGFDVQVVTATGTHDRFVPYVSGCQDPALHAQLRHTVMAAMQQLGEAPRVRHLSWTVAALSMVTPEFRRVTFQADAQTVQDWQPGYACRFSLNGEADGPSRPYTLRRVDPVSGAIQVDVYCHGGTADASSPGSRWALGLQVGQTVRLMAGRPETFPDFEAGPALLLADETGLPTVAALLEGWAHGPGPRVLLEVGAASTQRYLDDVALPAGTHVSWLPRQTQPGQDQPGRTLLQVLPDLDPVQAVWGALESGAARLLRSALRDEHRLPPLHCRVTGYWKHKA